MELNWPFADTPSIDADTEPHSPKRGHVWLRLLSTTDIHAHLLPYDYDRNTDVADFGLARTATLIEKARAEAPQSFLFDNGDFLQGTPLSDVLPLENGAQDACHPVIAAMNSLDYAAVCLGNHEFNFGLDRLEHTLAQAHFEVVCANVATELCPDDPARDTPLRAPFVTINTKVRDTHGRLERLTLGVIGFVPPQVISWDHTHLHGRVHTRDIVEAARAHVPVLRARGADIVIALAHTGITSDTPHPGMENAAVALAGVPGIDAIIAGHTHDVFPNPHFAAKRNIPATDIDHVHGTLCGVPAVMAGYRGSHLGVLDLRLTKSGGTWRVSAHKSQARPVQSADAVAAQPAHRLCAIVKSAHGATLERNAETIGSTDRSMHSYLAQVCVSPVLAPVLAAQREALAAEVAQNVGEGLPILSASPPFRIGGHAGPHAYTDIPAGPLQRRHVGDLYPFPNTLVGLKLSGADIVDWLERAASCFRQLSPGLRCQPLWDPAFAGHAFDTVSGISYQIDLTRPARYTAEGHLRDASARRITNVWLNGARLRQEQELLLATNNFRAFGGGPFKVSKQHDVVHLGQRLIRDLLADHLRRTNGPRGEAETPWTFAPVDGASVLLETGPGLRNYPSDMRQIHATDLGDTEDGFMRLDIPL